MEGAPAWIATFFSAWWETHMLSSTRPWLALGVLSASLSLLATCSDDPGPGSPSEGAWRIRPEPSLLIGELGSAPDESLYQPQGVARLSDGRLAVADGGLGRSRVSVFSPEGRYLKTLGGTGDGPGEFRWVTHLQAGPDDSLYAFDAQWQRLTVFSPDGRLARTTHFRIPVGVGSDGLFRVTRLSDGVWVGRGMESVIAAATPGEIRRDTIAVGLLDGRLTGFDPLEYLPGRMTTRIADGRFGGPPFTPSVLDATWGRCVFVTTADTPSIWVYSSDGQLVTRFDGPGVPRQVTQEHLDSLFESQVMSAPQAAKSRIRQWITEAARPDRLPYYNQMVIDEGGQLWLQEYDPPHGSGALWYVVSQSGRQLGTATMPRRVRVFAISASGVLLTRRGGLDESTVELLPLETGPVQVAEPLPQCTWSAGAEG